MNPVAYLAAPLAGPAPDSIAPDDFRRLALESLDGTKRIPLDGSTGWWRLPGSTGLELPPVDVIRGAVPGSSGSIVQESRVQEREIFVPVFTTSTGAQVAHLDMLDELRDLVDPLTGGFRFAGITARTDRVLDAVYTGGLEGSDGVSEAGRYWRKFGLTAVASQPFARARTPRTLEFGLASAPTPFLGAVGGTDAPWPPALATSSVIGSNMLVRVASEVPVYPTVELVGPMDSFTGSLAALEPDTNAFGGSMGEWSVSIPQGVPAGQTLRIVTDPRARSIRLDGALAAGRVARGSKLRPFYPGVNVLNVAAPGGTEATRVRLSWSDLYRSLW